MLKIPRRSFLAGLGVLIAGRATAQHLYEQELEVMERWMRHLSAPNRRSAEATCLGNGEKRIGYPGFEHCRLHPDYQRAFAKWNCQCYTGQCRPTLFRAVQHIDDPGSVYMPGYEIYASGTYYPIPKAAFRTEKADMSEALLAYDAHVCCNEPTAEKPIPHIECAWIKLES